MFGRLLTPLVLGLALAGCDGDPPAGPRPLSFVHAPAPIRRLSNVEYGNTLRDLLEVDLPRPELPPDTARSGLENDARALGASELLLSRYEETARSYATAAVADDARLARILGCSSWTTPTEIEACGASFVRGFGARAFRRPLTPEEIARFEPLFRGWALDIDVRGAAELTIAAMVQSPAFVYRVELAPLPSEGGPPSTEPIPAPPYELASRLSYALWQSLPDAELFAAAERGELADSGAVEAQARRMLEDARATAMMVDFHRQWLDLDRILRSEHGMRADDPSWDTTTQSEAHAEAIGFIELTLEEGDGTLGALFTSREALLSARMAALYGVPFTGAPGGLMRATLPETERAGILTRIAVLASHAHPGYASPPIRGNFVLDRMTCSPFGPPPRDADLSQPVPEPGSGPRTNRDLFTARTAAPICQSCHRRLDGVGFGLESYDARGVHRTIDNTLPVDASGLLVGLDVPAAYVGGVELSARLAESRTVQRCYAQRFVEMVWGRALTAGDAGAFDRIQRSFAGTGGRIDELLVSIVTDESFLSRHPVPE